MLPRKFPGETEQTTKGLNQNRHCPEKYRYRNLPITNLDLYYTSFLGVIPWEGGGEVDVMVLVGAHQLQTEFQSFRHFW